MGGEYTEKDILKMAIQAKQRGIDLYLILARNSENYHVGKLFTEFAKDEQHHKMRLEKWHDSIGDDGRSEAYPGEKALYLKALVDSSLYNCDMATTKALEKTVSEEDALQAGITFEKDFMLFLHDLKRNSAGGAEGIIDSLLDDEIKHLRGMFHLREKAVRKK